MAGSTPKAVRNAITIIDRLEKMTRVGSLRWEGPPAESYAYGTFVDPSLEGLQVCFPFRDHTEFLEFGFFAEADGDTLPFYTGAPSPLLEGPMQRLRNSIEVALQRTFSPPVTKLKLRQLKRALENVEQVDNTTLSLMDLIR